jgi:hypothetical protein
VRHKTRQWELKLPIALVGQENGHFTSFISQNK